LATTRQRASTAKQCRHCLSASEFVLNHEADAAGRAVLSQQDSPDEPIPPDVIGSESASRAAKRGWRGRLDSHRLGCATSARGRCIPTVSSVTAPVLRTSPLTAHPWTEVRAANRRSNDLEDSPMSRIFAGGEIGSPHWTISATDSFKKLRKSAFFREIRQGSYRVPRIGPRSSRDRRVIRAAGDHKWPWRPPTVQRLKLS